MRTDYAWSWKDYTSVKGWHLWPVQPLQQGYPVRDRTHKLKPNKWAQSEHQQNSDIFTSSVFDKKNAILKPKCCMFKFVDFFSQKKFSGFFTHLKLTFLKDLKVKWTLANFQFCFFRLKLFCLNDKWYSINCFNIWSRSYKCYKRNYNWKFTFTSSTPLRSEIVCL